MSAASPAIQHLFSLPHTLPLLAPDKSLFLYPRRSVGMHARLSLPVCSRPAVASAPTNYSKSSTLPSLEVEVTRLYAVVSSELPPHLATTLYNYTTPSLVAWLGLSSHMHMIRILPAGLPSVRPAADDAAASAACCVGRGKNVASRVAAHQQQLPPLRLQMSDPGRLVLKLAAPRCNEAST